MAEREGFETSFLKNGTAYTVSSSGSLKFKYIFPHINTYKHTSKGGGFTVERYNLQLRYIYSNNILKQFGDCFH